MTVIAWDGKVLAADRRSTGAYGTIFTTVKIERCDDGTLLGHSGDQAAGALIAHWWKNHRSDLNAFPYAQLKDASATMVVVYRTPEGQPKVEQYTTGPVPDIIIDAFTAWGSGRDFAIAAMHCGKTAVQAIEIASIYSVWCGNGVDAFEI